MQQEWDASTQGGDRITQKFEDSLAKKIADEILQQHKGQFGGVHSNKSMRAMLEKEARKHLANKQNKDMNFFSKFSPHLTPTYTLS